MSLIVLLKQKKALGGLALDGRAHPTGAADEVVQVSTTQKLDVVVQDLSWKTEIVLDVEGCPVPSLMAGVALGCGKITTGGGGLGQS